MERTRLKARKLKKKSCSRVTCCSACLSKDRAVTNMEKLLDMYREVLDYFEFDLQSEIYLCWECCAVVQRTKLFKDQVSHAQNIIKDHHLEREPHFPCLSNLKISNANPVLVLKHIEIGAECKVEIEIKQEQIPDEKESLSGLFEIKDVTVTKVEEHCQEQEEDKSLHDNNLVDEYNDNDNSVAVIKSETDIDIEIEEERPQKKRVRNRHFTFKTMEYTPALTPIQERLSASELESWLEMERNSSYFRNAKSKCTTCLIKLNRHNSLTKHINTCHKSIVGRFVCSICTCRFRTEVALDTHVAGHYIGRRCQPCGYMCYTAQHMAHHMRSHLRTVECKYCDKCFSTTRQFEKHYKVAHLSLICDYCGKTRSSKALMEQHIVRHHLKFQCRLCNSEYKTYWTLKQHRLQKHDFANSEAAFCVQCDKQFPNVRVFKQHLSTSAAHAAERPVKIRAKVPCPSCDKVYARRYFMVNHYRHVHAKQSPHYCELCRKHFLTATRLRDHRRRNHEGFLPPRDKLCNLCGRGFSTNRILTNHMRTHTGERPYHCPHCDSKFAQKTPMLTHIKFIHEKAKRT